MMCCRFGPELQKLTTGQDPFCNISASFMPVNHILIENNHQADFLCLAVGSKPLNMSHSWASSITWLLAITICTGEDVIRGTLTMSYICTRAMPQGRGTIIPLSPPSLSFPSFISWYSWICSFFIFKRSALLPPPQTCQNQFAPLLSSQTNFTVTSSCLSPFLKSTFCVPQSKP